MKAPSPDKPLHFIRAAQEDTALLSSVLDWLDHEREIAVNALIQAKDHDTMLKMQGQILAVAELRRKLGDMTRAK